MFSSVHSVGSILLVGFIYFCDVKATQMTTFMGMAVPMAAVDDVVNDD